jgi:hypothetical protein
MARTTRLTPPNGMPIRRNNGANGNADSGYHSFAHVRVLRGMLTPAARRSLQNLGDAQNLTRLANLILGRLAPTLRNQENITFDHLGMDREGFQEHFASLARFVGWQFIELNGNVRLAIKEEVPRLASHGEYSPPPFRNILDQN